MVPALADLKGMDRSDRDDAQRNAIHTLLRQGLATEWCDRADDSDAVNRVVAQLAATDHSDLAALLRIAGFTPTPYRNADGDGQACATCMYYAQHRRFCELPELRLPVLPEWSCRLWRI